MKKVYTYIPIVALICTPIVIYQWNMKFVWLKLDANTEIYSYIYLFSSVYILAYILIYKNYKIGYYIMWLTCITLLLAQVLLLDFNWFGIIASIDLWLNLIITANALLGTKKQSLRN